MLLLIQFMLLITPKPTADAGADERICEGSDITLSTASCRKIFRDLVDNIRHGILENSTTLTPTYHPGIEDIANRTVVLTLHARGRIRLKILLPLIQW